ncbi:hypothetical protein MBANPS3_011159 [Mucor bainieri]
MNRLPTEIVFNIFHQLPIYSQHQCLQVCKSWNTVARVFTSYNTHTVELQNNNDMENLVKLVAADPSQGLAIRKIHFIKETDIFHPIKQHEFIDLINGCPRLAEIMLNNQTADYLCRRDAKLPQVERIRWKGQGFSPKLNQKYFNLTYEYRATLNQLCVNVNVWNIKSLNLSTISDYVKQFPCLKYLSLETSCPVMFADLIQACPQLQWLSLNVDDDFYSDDNCFDVMDAEQDNAPLDLNSVSQLETLKIDNTLMSKQLYRYLKYRCAFLYHLVITLSTDTGVYSLIDTFDAFKDAEALTITDVSFNNYSSAANGLMQNLSRWFLCLNQVDIKGFDLKDLSSNRYNLSLDFNQANLLYVTINIRLFLAGPFCAGKASPVEKIALELNIGNKTSWYQREGKWKTGKQFVLKDSVHYRNSKLREKRMRSGTTVGANTLKHRVVLALLTRFCATPEAVPTDLQAKYYEQRASDGGILVPEVTFISRLTGAYPQVPGIYNQAQIDGWKKITSAYLNHNQEQVISAFDIPSPGKALAGDDDEVPRALIIDGIKFIVIEYAQAAKNAIEAGFDIVEIHGANDYLIDQFINDSSNNRTDIYRGSAENRGHDL